MKRDKPDNNGDEDNADGEGGEPSHSADKIDPWGENPDWDPSWVKAHKINYLGRVKCETLSSKYITESIPRLSTWRCLGCSTSSFGESPSAITTQSKSCPSCN